MTFYTFLKLNNISDYRDILVASYNAWSYMAEETGIDANSLVNNNYHAGFYKGSELPLINKKYKGKSYLRIWRVSLKNGTDCPILYFGTHKHGGITHKFNGYKWLWLLFKSNLPLITLPVCTIKNNNRATLPQVDYFPRGNATTKEVNKNFIRLNTLFKTLSSVMANNTYLSKKCPWLDENILNRLTLKQGRDNWGYFIIAPMQNINGNITGFQRIYEQNIATRNSNKDFCVKYPGGKKGAFIYIAGDEYLGYVAVCEGLTTALSFADKEQAPIYVALDAGNLYAVCQMLTSPIRLYCDNDFWSKKNTGLEVGLKIKNIIKNTHLLVPPTEMYANTNDYNDLRHVMVAQEFNRCLYFQQKTSQL